MENFDMIHEYECVCYHGTDKRNINPIIEEGFNPSDKDNESLGEGIYFYERDIFQAIAWCTRAQSDRIENPAVLKAIIKTDKLIDLTLTSHYDYLMHLSEEVHQEYERRLRQKGYQGEPLTLKKIFDILYKVKEYCAIRHVFRVRKGGRILGTGIFRVQVQICIKSQEAIIDLEEVDLSEYQEVS